MNERVVPKITNFCVVKLSISLAITCVPRLELNGPAPRHFESQPDSLRINQRLLRLKTINPATLLFSDRPDRVTGHEPTKDFVDDWDEGDDSFKSNPPNATLSILSGPEPQDIRSGDCVSIEQGDYANIRRVSSYHRETEKRSDLPQHHQSASDNCQIAKNELTKAETDQAITNAAKKVRILCED